MHKFTEANSFSIFMLLVIVANCAILIAMTFEIVVVRGGKAVVVIFVILKIVLLNVKLLNFKVRRIDLFRLVLCSSRQRNVGNLHHRGCSPLVCVAKTIL